MDLRIILDGWRFDEEEEANNVRKIIGLDRRPKLQIRLRDGVIQWEVDGPPSGDCPYGCQSVLAYCKRLVQGLSSAEPASESVDFRLDDALLDELESELNDYTKRRQAFLLIGDYYHALRDALHALEILEFVREWVDDSGVVFHFDRGRPAIIADRAHAEAFLGIQGQQLQQAVRALSKGVEEIEEFFQYHALAGQIPKSLERRALIDLRRSLRERYNVPLTDAELLHTLRAEQQVAIEQENYEMAARLRDKIGILRQRMEGTR